MQHVASDGGAFTMWGLVPALRIDTNPTPRQLVERIRAALDIDTQTCTLTAGKRARRGRADVLML